LSGRPLGQVQSLLFGFCRALKLHRLGLLGELQAVLRQCQQPKPSGRVNDRVRPLHVFIRFLADIRLVRTWPQCLALNIPAGSRLQVLNLCYTNPHIG
jgi:hypothetical protein